MLIITFLSRLVFFHLLLGFYLCFLFCNHLLGLVGFSHSKPFAIKFTKYFAKVLLWTFNIKTHVNLKDNPPGCLYISNHMSYLDAIAIFAHIDGVFITSTDIRDTIGLGALCKMAQCIFVNRQRIWGLKREIKVIQSNLQEGYNIILFPEGTTSSGHSLKEFKSSLLESSVALRRPIIPLAINYTKFNGRKPLLEDRDYYCWYGSMDFLPHIIRLCSIKSLHIEVTQTDTLQTNGLKGERKLKCRLSKATIGENFDPVAITN